MSSKVHSLENTSRISIESRKSVPSKPPATNIFEVLLATPGFCLGTFKSECSYHSPSTFSKMHDLSVVPGLFHPPITKHSLSDNMTALCMHLPWGIFLCSFLRPLLTQNTSASVVSLTAGFDSSFLCRPPITVSFLFHITAAAYVGITHFFSSCIVFHLFVFMSNSYLKLSLSTTKDFL